MLCGCVGPLEPPLLSAVLRALRHQLLPPPAARRLAEALVHTAAQSPPAAAASLAASLLLMSPPPSSPQAAHLDPQAAAEGRAPQVSSWAARQWPVCEVALMQLQRVLPASVLLHSASDLLRQLLAPALGEASGAPQAGRGRGGGASGRQGPPRSLSLLLSSGGVEEAAALAVHARVALHLVAEARRELEAPAHAEVAGALPAWLAQALPALVAWHCMATQVLLQDVGAAGAGAGGTGWAREQQRWGAEAVAVRLCAGQPGLALALLQHAAEAGGQLHATGLGQGAAGEQQQQQQQQQAAERQCRAALLSLARALLTDGVARRQCLAAGPAARAAAEQLASGTGLPAHVASDLACMSLAQQVSQAAQELFGA